MLPSQPEVLLIEDTAQDARCAVSLPLRSLENEGHTARPSSTCMHPRGSLSTLHRVAFDDAASLWHMRRPVSQPLAHNPRSSCSSQPRQARRPPSCGSFAHGTTCTFCDIHDNTRFACVQSTANVPACCMPQVSGQRAHKPLRDAVQNFRKSHMSTEDSYVHVFARFICPREIQK